MGGPFKGFTTDGHPLRGAGRCNNEWETFFQKLNCGFFEVVFDIFGCKRAGEGWERLVAAPGPATRLPVESIAICGVKNKTH